MIRKDYEKTQRFDGPHHVRVSIACGLALAALAGMNAHAGTIRVWPAAVVVDDFVRMDDVCDFQGFSEEAVRSLSEWIVTDSPPAGGTRIIHMDMIRSALSAGGLNMATVTLCGGAVCEVTRPANPIPRPERQGATESQGKRPNGRGESIDRSTAGAGSAAGIRNDSTLRQTILDYFNNDLKRYGGTANVVFDRASEQVLDLAGPEYTFSIRRRKGMPLGLTSVEVDVLAGTRVVQTVSLIVQVTMTRRVVAARKSINHRATIRPSDVHLVSTIVARLDGKGLDDVALAIGQRAKRFISIGAILEPSLLEEVPLVKRGELVTISAAIGGVRVVTTAKAAGTGLLGEVVRIRSLSDRHVEYDAVVVGPGRVEMAEVRLPIIHQQVATRAGS
ncbi:MAG: flagellar basal body P-ring formation protein FlgA [Planctomycetes bacterium]|nr:flagellar basal body P-ring formation protein FlgA [Planctomycetota bacterium]